MLAYKYKFPTIQIGRLISTNESSGWIEIKKRQADPIQKMKTAYPILPTR